MAPHEHDLSHASSHETAGAAEGPQDAAAASLARALRLSFWVLSIIMLLVLAGFVFSGVTTIENGEKGIVTIFGRKVAVVDPGLHYTWPFPIGEIEKVVVRQQVLDIDQFWMGESPEDKTKPLESRTPSSKGLRPGWDGALLTGDAFLFHVKLQAFYEVEDAVAFRSGLADPNEGIEAAVCRAAILTAARRTVAEIVDGEEKSAIAREIRDLAQATLRQMKAGVRLTEISFSQGPTRPLHVLPAQQAAQNAAQEERDARVGAIREAGDFLRSAVGPQYVRLVGEPWAEREPRVLAPGEVDADYDLIGQYEAARREANAPPGAGEGILKQIDDILWSLSTQGEVAAIRGAAESHRDARRSAVDARANALEQLLAEYDKAPDFFLQTRWAETRREILWSPGIIKWFLNPGQAKTILQINTPPEILREIQTWYMRGPAPAPPPPPPSSPPPEDRGGP